MFINGELVKGEAVADFGGLCCMLETAKGVDGFDYELLFESYAEYWRRVRLAEAFSDEMSDPERAAELSRRETGLLMEYLQAGRFGMKNAKQHIRIWTRWTFHGIAGPGNPCLIRSRTSFWRP